MAEEPTPAATERRFTARDGRVVQLRPAQAEDAGPLLAALNEVAAEGRYLLTRHWEITPELEARWLHTATESRDLLLVATVAAAEDAPAEIAGSVSLVRRPHEFVRHTAELGMWLRAAYREIGIGSAMVEVALAWAAAHEIEKITLSVRSNNRRALSLYQKYGFVEEGRRRGYIKTPHGYEDECLLSYSSHPLPAPPGTSDPHGFPLDVADADE
jgi:RimJ/RimL family protein N-acetyltransferase